MARHYLGTYVWWRTPIPTPRWLDNVHRGPLYPAWCWARSTGVIRIRPSVAGRALLDGDRGRT